MLFPTFDFAIFFAIAFTVNWLLNPYPVPWKLSMIALSYFFYGWVGWSYCLLLASTTAIAFIGGAAVSSAESERRRRVTMGLSCAALLGLLGWFKYYGFVSVNFDNLTHVLGLGRAVPLLQVALPIAISFYTFMALSYVIDIYRRQLEPARPLDLALYLSFFPHLLAGPIVRGNELLPQLRRRRDPSAVDYSRGLWLILAGLFKKVVISSYVSTAIVQPVFTAPAQHSAPEAIFAAWGYAVQIYCDFSGYTDIAIGLALLLGIRFPDNFNAPYTARNLQEFWRRWHMTLSRWLRDYLYIPLGGNSGSEAQTVRNIMITMVLGGLWHGAAWTFVFWGALHGVGQSVAHVRRLSRVRRGLPAGARRAGADLGAAVPDLPVRLSGVGVLQCQRALQRLRRAGASLHGMGRALAAGHSAAGAGRGRDDRLPAGAPDQGGAPAGPLLPAALHRAGRPALRGPARRHHLRARRRGPLHLLPLLMVDENAPPHTSTSEGTDVARRTAPWTRVLGISVAAFLVWLLLFAPTLQHNAQVSPVGTRRTVALDILGPIAATSRALQLSRIVSLTDEATGRTGNQPGNGTALTVIGPRGHHGRVTPKPPSKAGRGRRLRRPRRPRRPSPPSRTRPPPIRCGSSSWGTRSASTWVARCRTTWPTPGWSRPRWTPGRARGSPGPTTSTGRPSCSPIWPRRDPRWW